jgi:anti-sigma factor RsiW
MNVDECPINLLSAFIDGELDLSTRERVAAHVAMCAKCQAEVESLRELSRALQAYRVDELKPMERARLHQQLDEQVDAPIWRLGGAVGLIAASILIIAATWLAAIPSTTPRDVGPTVAAAPAEWEQIAFTLRVDVPGETDPRLDQWMLEQLAMAEQR